ncbi:MAG: hypothetical protein IT302_09010 [Dehalococcoidia bacterium]|nr:hypothetical protein [Dehalococcoidia bacterium]
MTARVAPANSPPLGLVAPFLLLAPIGLIAAGMLIATAGDDTFAAINAPHTVAITHALVLGWVTTLMMGALYQLGAAVIGGRLLSEPLARAQLVLHVCAVALFTWAVEGWRTDVMPIAGSLVILSFALFAANLAHALLTSANASLPRLGAGLGISWLAVTGGIGLTYALAVSQAWFPITLGRLAAHAHAGLAGWLGLTLMGVSFQLVPMFNVAKAKPRHGTAILYGTAAAVAIFALAIAFDPPWPVRVALALLLAAGPSAASFEIVRLMRARSKRRLDIQGRGTFVSVSFFAATVVLGLLAAIGEPVAPGGEPARVLLAYGIVGIGGWMGCAMIGNSFKILPFLLWYHRYRPRVGIAPVPVVGDIYSETVATIALASHAFSVVWLAVAALAGSMVGLHAGGVLLALSAAVHCTGLAHTLLPKTSSRDVPSRTPVVQ